MRHRIFLKRLCLFMTLGLLGVICSWAEDYTKNGIVYAIDAANSTASVKGVTNKNDITIANIRTRVLGCDVTSIGANAFDGCSLLKEVTIPASVTSIESASFKGCSSLTSINIPTQVTDINSSTFEGCSALKNINFSSIRNIGGSAFKGCESLTTIDIPNVEVIEDSVFARCYSLESINNMSSVHRIWESAFKDCRSLKEIYIPSLYRNSLGKSAFEGCSSLKKAKFNDVYILQARLFKGCTSLTSIDLSYVETINSEAFAGCTSLTSIDLSYVETIKPEAFAGCTSLQTVRFGSSIDFIDEAAFSGCTAIKSFDIPSNASLTSEGSIIFNKDKTSLICAAGDLKSYVIPNTVTQIFNFAFSGCTYLTNVSIPSSVKIIGKGAFAGDHALSTILLKSKEVSFKSTFIRFFTDEGIEYNGTAIPNTTKVYCIPKNEDNSMSDSFHMEVEYVGNGGTWYFPEYVTNISSPSDFSYNRFNSNISDISDIITTNDDAKKLIADRSTIYNNLDEAIRTPLENILSETNDFDNLFSLEDSELLTLKEKLSTAYNNVRYAIYEQLSSNDDLYDLYQEGSSNVEGNELKGIPSDFYVILDKAKKELDAEWATEETIEKLQEMINAINNATIVDFSKSEYITFYSNKAAIVPEQMSAAIVVSNGNSVYNKYCYKANDVIPANTGVLLKSTKGDSFYMLEGNTTETSPEENLLHGTLNDEMTNVEGAGTYYKLSYDRDTKSVIGFYWGATDGAAFLNKAGKAFLALPATMNAQQLKGFSLIDLDKSIGNITGIDNVTSTSSAASNAYELNGRKVNPKSLNDLQHGIYIVNGKKIIK